MKAAWCMYGTSSHLRYPFLPVCEFPLGREVYKRLSIGSWTSECAEQGHKKNLKSRIMQKRNQGLSAYVHVSAA